MDKREYREYLKSDDWRNKRAKFIQYVRRCNKGVACCTVCGVEETLDVHHLNYRNIYDVTFDDLTLLCRPCHESVHKYDMKLQKKKMKKRIKREKTRRKFTKQKKKKVSARKQLKRQILREEQLARIANAFKRVVKHKAIKNQPKKNQNQFQNFLHGFLKLKTN